MDIILSKELGFNVASIPTAIFDLVHSYGGIFSDIPGGGFKVQVAGEAVQRIINEITAIKGPIRRENITGGGIKFNITYGSPAQATLPNTATPARNVEANTNPDSREEEIDLDDDPGEEECEECGETECKCAKIRDVIKDGPSGSFPLILYKGFNNKIADNTQIKIELASRLGTETSVRARRLKDALTVYNTALNKMINAKRDIDTFSKLVDSDEILKNLISQIIKLKLSNALIENVFFIKNYIVIETKHLVTNELPDKTVRDVGRMAFCIGLNNLLSHYSANENNNVKPVTILNLTREVNGWMCGHVNSEGEACFGEWSAPVADAIGSTNLEAISDVLIRFVRSPYITDSWGSKILNFPIKVKDGEVVSEKKETSTESNAVAATGETVS